MALGHSWIKANESVATGAELLSSYPSAAAVKKTPHADSSSFPLRFAWGLLAVWACAYLLLRRFPGAFALMRRSLRRSAVRSA